MNEDVSRFTRLKERFPEASEDDLQRYLDLREEGYRHHEALLMSGLSDPPDPDKV